MANPAAQSAVAKPAQTFMINLKRNWVVYLAEWLLILIVVTDYALGTRNISHKLGNWFYLLPVAGLILATLPFFKEWHFYRHKYIALAVGHTVVGLFLVYLTDVYGPYFQVLILLLFASIFWFGMVGLIVSLSLEFLIVVISTWVNYGSLSPDLTYVMGIHLITLVILGVLFERVSLRHRRQEADTAQLLQTVSFERTRLLSLINSMADAVIAADSRGRIVLYNGASLDLLNTNISLEGKFIGDFLPLKNDQDKPVDIIKESKRADTVLKRDDLYFLSNEGQKVRLYIDISPIRSGFLGESEEGFIMLLRDITKEKSLDEQRSEFISVTSHELRTPIAIAEANVSTALLPNVAAKLDKQVTELLKQAHDQIIFLGDLVNDLTTLARAERGDLEIEIEPINPKQLIAQLVKDYREEAKTKGLKLVATPTKTGIKSVSTSPLYVREILQNFVTNALKYTPKGSITLAVAPTKTGGVIFSVTDTGVGIAAGDKKKIFGKFFRAEDYRTRATRGTGLGLYITVKLVERLGGRVWLKSRLNKGSTFYLEVPPYNAHRQSSANRAQNN